MHRLDEVDVVHGRGDHVGARVPVGGHGAGQIDEVHQPAAQQIAQGVGVVGQNDLSHLRLRAGHRARRRVGFSRNSFVACSIFLAACVPHASSPPATMRHDSGAAPRHTVPVSAIHANYANRLEGAGRPTTSQHGQDRRTERDSRAGPEEQLCALRHRHGTGQARRNGRRRWRSSTPCSRTIPTTRPATSWRRKRWPTPGASQRPSERLKAGISCAARTGNRHALSEMQAMLDELDR